LRQNSELIHAKRESQSHHLSGTRRNSVLSAESVRRTFLWCAVISYGILVIWFLFFMLAQSWIYLRHSRWFHMSVEQFDRLHYAGMAIYTIGVLLFNLVPFIVLYIVDRNISG